MKLVVANAKDFTPSWGNFGDDSGSGDFVPSFMKAPVPQQPSITNQFAKKKPITLASLGVSNQNLGPAEKIKHIEMISK